MWDLVRKCKYAVLTGHDSVIWKLAITNDDKYIVSGEWFEGIRVWSISEKRQEYWFKTLSEANNWLARAKEVRFEFLEYLF